METLIFRFSDYEVDTIGAHLIVLAAQPAVWWGWWKKEHEPLRYEILSQAAAASPLTIGIIDRKGPRFFVADCTEIAVAPEGERTTSPDPAATPEYYSTTPFPAWLKLTSIKPVDEGEWLDRFGALPEGDPTLYWVETSASGRKEVLPMLEFSGEVDSPGNAILHLSDLHFGADHGYATHTHTPGLGVPMLVDVVADRLDALGESVGVVLVSGDLITKGEEESYSSDVQPMLERLATRLSLERSHFVIVPGNHDIPIAADEPEPNPTREFRHESRFRDFLRSFYGADIQEIECLRRYRTTSGWHVAVVGLNSVRLRSPETKEYGYVGHRGGPWLSQLSDAHGRRDPIELADDHVLNIAALHHHILPGELLTRPEKNRPVSLTLDAGQLIRDCQRASVHLIAHGHQHIPFFGSTGRAARSDTGDWAGGASRLLVSGGGSAGAGQQRMPDEMRDNTFALYRPDGGTLHVHVEQFTPGATPHPYMDIEVPLCG